MKTISFIAISIVILGAIIAGLGGLLRIEGLAASMHISTSTFTRIVYSVIAITGVIVAFVVFARNSRSNIPGRMGRSSGAERGPEPGDGAVIHHAPGEADFGVPGNVLPAAKKTDRDQPYPPAKSAD